MALHVSEPGELQPGDLFEDCRFHPCLCVEVGGPDDLTGVYGISLVDGTWSNCDIRHCGLRKLTVAEAARWKRSGPPDYSFPPEDRWW